MAEQTIAPIIHYNRTDGSMWYTDLSGEEPVLVVAGASEAAAWAAMNVTYDLQQGCRQVNEQRRIQYAGQIEYYQGLLAKGETQFTDPTVPTMQAVTTSNTVVEVPWGPPEKPLPPPLPYHGATPPPAQPAAPKPAAPAHKPAAPAHKKHGGHK